MIVPAFTDNINLGGYGDRIVNVIASRIISKLLNKKCFILWSKENIKKYLEYNDYETLDGSFNDIKKYKCIDDLEKFKNYLINDPNPFPNHINIIYNNQEISQFLFQNNLFNTNDYQSFIFNEYKLLYSEIFKPTPLILDKVNKLLPNNSLPTVGIQLRIGDNIMKDKNNKQVGIFLYPDFRNLLDSKGKRTTLFLTVKRILNTISGNLNKLYGPRGIDASGNINYNVFITSDYSSIYDIASEIWDPTQIIYNNDDIQHIDKNPTDNGIFKVIVDNYILSQKTDILYISVHSNYGRVAALSATHSNIYNNYCEKLSLNSILAKSKIR